MTCGAHRGADEPTPETMYVSEFKIADFRSHLDVEALLQPTLTCR
jgi:hypothetical protein